MKSSGACAPEAGFHAVSAPRRRPLETELAGDSDVIRQSAAVGAVEEQQSPGRRVHSGSTLDFGHAGDESAFGIAPPWITDARLAQRERAERCADDEEAGVRRGARRLRRRGRRAIDGEIGGPHEPEVARDVARRAESEWARAVFLCGEFVQFGAHLAADFTRPGWWLPGGERGAGGAEPDDEREACDDICASGHLRLLRLRGRQCSTRRSSWHPEFDQADVRGDERRVYG